VDKTAFASGLTSVAKRAGLLSWTVTIDGICPAATPDIGRAGLITYASGYAAKVNQWNVAMASSVHDITAFASGGVVWREFMPGILTHTGGYQALVDKAVDLGLPTLASASSAAMTLQSHASNTLAGNVIVTATDLGIEVGGLNGVSFNFDVDGALTAAGSTNILPAGAIGLPRVGRGRGWRGRSHPDVPERRGARVPGRGVLVGDHSDADAGRADDGIGDGAGHGRAGAEPIVR